MNLLIAEDVRTFAEKHATSGRPSRATATEKSKSYQKEADESDDAAEDDEDDSEDEAGPRRVSSITVTLRLQLELVLLLA